MSKLMTFYNDNGIINSAADIDNNIFLLDLQQCRDGNSYIAPSNIGYSFDFGQAPIGKRPVHRPYEIGTFSEITQPLSYKDNSNYLCKQPCWNKHCK